MKEKQINYIKLFMKIIVHLCTIAILETLTLIYFDLIKKRQKNQNVCQSSKMFFEELSQSLSDSLL